MRASLEPVQGLGHERGWGPGWTLRGPAWGPAPGRARRGPMGPGGPTPAPPCRGWRGPRPGRRAGGTSGTSGASSRSACQRRGRRGSACPCVYAVNRHAFLRPCDPANTTMR